MKKLLHSVLLFGPLTIAQIAPAQFPRDNESVWVTNSPAVFAVTRISMSNNPASPPGKPIKTFQGFQPGSLNNLIWTNFIAHTNGRDMTIWTTRTHPADWPAHPPLVTWNPLSLFWGMKGVSALSPCWQSEGASGQVPVTALTRRHAYTRGHGMGPDGLNENFAGKKIWFVTTNNTLVVATVLRDIVRTYGISRRDYTILLLSKDLPPGIEPLRVVSPKELETKYPYVPGTPRPIFKTEQRGQVSSEVDGLRVATLKGGDSGSPDLLPMPGELVFIQGRTTGGASPAMQTDMDELSKSAHLDPKKYQLRWLDLSSFSSEPANKN